jgi:hypothetical protein
MLSLTILPIPATKSIRMAKHPARIRRWFSSMGGRKFSIHPPSLEFLIRLGSEARAKKGNTELTPTNWRSPLKKIMQTTAQSLSRP